MEDDKGNTIEDIEKAVKYISWESGKRVPSVDSFNKIMTALGAELTVVAK